MELSINAKTLFDELRERKSPLTSKLLAAQAEPVEASFTVREKESRKMGFPAILKS